jgi:hypothetical protein
MMRSLVVLGLAILGACLHPNTLDCPGGGTCPAGKMCTPTGDCALPEQVAACSGLDEEAPCTYGTTIGTCAGGACVANFCGDGKITAPEECDGPELGSNTCHSLGYYDDTPALSCDAHCRYDISRCTGYCGDGAVNGPELCEQVPGPGQSCASSGYDTGHVRCTGSCTLGFEGCDVIGWRPLAVGPTNGLFGVWGTAADDIFAVGFGGTIVHYDGSRWSTMTSGTTVALQGVWGSGPNDVFAVGSQTILHYDGTAWSPMSGAATVGLNAVWGTGPTDVFAVGGEVLHFDGVTWTPLPVGSGYSVWGSGPNDVYFVGGYTPTQGTVYHYDGATVTNVASAACRLKGVWGTGPNDVFVVGDNTNSSPGAISDLVMHFDGTSWSTTGTTQFHLDGVWGSGPDDVFAIGKSGGVLHYDGVGWSIFPFPFTSQLDAMWGSTASDVIVVGSGGAFMYPGSAWMPMVSGVTGRLSGVAGSSPVDVYATSSLPPSTSQLLHSSDGVTWSLIDLSQSPWNLPRSSINSVWEDAGGQVFAVGLAHSIPTTDDTIFHWDADPIAPAWSAMTTGLATISHLNAVWGSSPTDVFAVGDSVMNNGYIIHYNGAWAEMIASTSDYLLGVWGSAPNDVFAVGGPETVGGGGSIQHYDGNSLGTWTTMTTTTQMLLAVAGIGPNDVFAVGKAGTILHYDGINWNPMDSGTTLDLYAVWPRGPNDVYAAGQDGIILHLDSLGWVPVRSNTTFRLTSVWGSRDSIHFVGDGGTTLQLVRTAP